MPRQKLPKLCPLSIDFEQLPPTRISVGNPETQERSSLNVGNENRGRYRLLSAGLIARCKIVRRADRTRARLLRVCPIISLPYRGGIPGVHRKVSSRVVDFEGAEHPVVVRGSTDREKHASSKPPRVAMPRGDEWFLWLQNAALTCRRDHRDKRSRMRRDTLLLFA